MDYNWTRLAADFIADISWPLAILIIVWTFKDSIIGLVKRVIRFKFGDLEIDLSGKLDEIERQVDQLQDEKLATPSVKVKADLVSGPASVSGRLNAVEEAPTVERSRSQREYLDDLASSKPDASIVAAWIEVERELKSSLERCGVPWKQRPRIGVRQIINKLQHLEVISNETANILNELYSVRNALAHSHPGTSVSIDDALRYINITDDMIQVLRGIGD